MEINKQNKNKEVIFPENSPEIINSILKKYGLEETTEEIIRKLKRGEISNTQKLAGIVGEAARKKTSIDTVALWIEEDLKVSKEVALKMAKDLNERILSLTVRPEIKKTASEKISLKEKKPEISPKESFQPDIYREPIE